MRREFMKDPHVGVFVSTVESHPISVVGAVRKPGVFQVRGPRWLLEMISMADGVTDDAGDKVLIERGAGLHPEVLAALAGRQPRRRCQPRRPRSRHCRQMTDPGPARIPRGYAGRLLSAGVC